jgi:hypothetical protein
VLIRGRVSKVISEGAEVHIDRLARKYLGEDKYPWRALGEKRVLLRIEPMHISVR